MLKNPANKSQFSKVHLSWSVTDDDEKAKRLYRVMRFIEQCPLKIKRIKIEGFV